MNSILNCRKCGEYPKISAYRDGGGYSALIRCRCSSVKRHRDIVRWAMAMAAEGWNEQNGGNHAES